MNEVQPLALFGAQAFPTALMYSILSFPNLVATTEGQVAAAFEYDGPPWDDAFEERQEAYAALGLKALSLVDELRETYKIPPRDYKNWNPTTLEGEKKRLRCAAFKPRKTAARNTRKSERSCVEVPFTRPEACSQFCLFLQRIFLQRAQIGFHRLPGFLPRESGHG